MVSHAERLGVIQRDGETDEWYLSFTLSGEPATPRIPVDVIAYTNPDIPFMVAVVAGADGQAELGYLALKPDVVPDAIEAETLEVPPLAPASPPPIPSGVAGLRGAGLSNSSGQDDEDEERKEEKKAERRDLPAHGADPEPPGPTAEL